MAGVYGEFDAPSPAPKSYCSRISTLEFERQSSVQTENALKELLDYLEDNPTAFYDVVAKRKKDEVESNNGFFGFLKFQMMSWLYSQEKLGALTSREAKEKFSEFKENVIKSYDYGQEAKGSVRRFSRRVAERKWRQVAADQNQHYVKKRQSCVEQHETMFPIPPSLNHAGNSSSIPPTLPPPPPPPLPSSTMLHDTKFKTKRNQLDNEKENVTQLNTNQIFEQRKHLKPMTVSNKEKTMTNKDGCDFTQMMEFLKNPNTRKVLKPISQNSDPFITPAQVHKKRKAAERDSETCTMFNQELIQKFKLAQGSPLVESPQSGREFTP